MCVRSHESLTGMSSSIFFIRRDLKCTRPIPRLRLSSLRQDPLGNKLFTVMNGRFAEAPDLLVPSFEAGMRRTLMEKYLDLISRKLPKGNIESSIREYSTTFVPLTLLLKVRLLGLEGQFVEGRN